MRRDTDAAADGWSIGRRELFGLAGAAALTLAGCGKSGSSPVRAVRSTPESSAVTSASAAARSTAASPSAAPTATIGGAHVRSGAITVDNARREATVANGTWLGAWHDTAGNSGTSDVTIDIDGSTRIARATVAFTGLLLGTAVPSQAYEVDLASFVLLADSWTVDSPQFGTVTVVPGGDVQGGGSAKNVPGHPEIAAITVQATKSGRRVDLNYTVQHTAGTTVEGTMAWSAAGSRATPRPVAATR